MSNPIETILARERQQGENEYFAQAKQVLAPAVPERCWYLRAMCMDEYLDRYGQVRDAGPTDAERAENLRELARSIYWGLMRD